MTTNNYPNLTATTLDAIATYMDDELREELHSEMAPCEPGEFLTAYVDRAEDRDPEFIDVLNSEFGSNEELA